MADEDVVTYLASKGYRGRQANGPEVVFPCFFSCQEAPDSRKRKLYINTEDGVFFCHVCGSTGGMRTLHRHFGDDPNTGSSDEPFVRRQILNWSADVGSAMLQHNDDVMLYLLNERGLSPETILENKIGFVGNGWSLTQSLPEQFSKTQLETTGLVWKNGPRAGQDFFYNHILIPYYSRGSVVQMRGRAWDNSKGGKYLTGPGEDVRLYGTDTLDDAEEAIIVEGEFDAMVLRQHLQGSPEARPRKIAVVGLAGANGFKDGFEKYFANCRRVYVGLDPDDTGKREAVKIKERLGSRGRIVELPPELPKCDWSEYLMPVPAEADTMWKAKHIHAGHRWQDVISLLGRSAGKRLFSISEAGMAWRNRREVGEGIKTGYRDLDSVILPGLLPGQVVVILAKTGTGKTVLLCNFAYFMRGQRILFLSLEMTREEVYERLLRIYLFHNPKATQHEAEEALANVYICDENRLGEKDFTSLVEEYEAETGARPEVCFVDYLGYYARGAKGNTPYEKTTNAVMQLKAEAKKARMAVIAPAQVNRLAKEGKPIDLDDARDSGAIEETADFLFAIYKPDEALTLQGDNGSSQPSGKVKLTVLKSRHGGKGRTISIQFDLLTLAMVDAETQEARRAMDHNHLAWRGYTYEDLRRRETAPRQLHAFGAES